MFTIIIPTHERHELLLRAIDYYQHFDCDVLVADSSINRLNYEFPENIIYKHLPDLNFVQKILEVAGGITTPYVCISADDDYLLESGLQEAAHFLENNHDFVSAQGRYLKFEIVGGQVVFSPKYSQQASCYSVADEDSFSRAVRAYNPYMHHFYSMQRIDMFIKSFRLSANISVPFMVELATILVPVCYGKHKVLPILWEVRDTFKFYRPGVYATPALEKAKHNLVSFNYKTHNQIVDQVKVFLGSEEGRRVKKEFASVISDLVSNDKESDNIFNAAFKSYINWVIGNRNKVIIKIILKAVIPDWVLNYYRTRQTIKHMGGVDTDSSTKNTLDKIRLSVLTFSKCYLR